MSSVSSGQKTWTEFIYSVPLNGSGETAVIGDVYDAIQSAGRDARSVGLRTSSDDWLRVRQMDDHLEFFFQVADLATRVEWRESEAQAKYDKLVKDLQSASNDKTVPAPAAIVINEILEKNK